MDGRDLKAWLGLRLPLAALRDFAAHKTVPIHRYSVLYYLGGMTLFFLGVQVATGILLMLYYRPGIDAAFESVEFIVTTVSFGWLIRSVHVWSASLVIFFAALHLVSVFFVKAYRAPRELTWLSGCLLLFLLLGFGFSGYLLPWNQLALFATKVGTDIAGSLPGVGDWLLRFLRGGDRVSGATLSRFYGWHVAILPAATTGLLLFHLVQVQLQGMSVPPSVERSQRRLRSMPFVPHFLLRDIFGWLLALGVLTALAGIFPWEIGEKADPFAPAPPNIRPEWYFMFMFETLKLFPGGEIFGVEYEAIPILLAGLGALALCAVPFLDRGRLARGRPSPIELLGALTLVYIVGTTAWGYRSLVPLGVAVGAGVGVVLLGLAMRPPRAGHDR